MMHMTFYWGKTVTILFDKWKTDTWLGYALSLLALLLVAAFLQYLEDHRIRLKILASSNISPSQPSFKVPFLSSPPSAAAARLALAALFGVNSALGYLLMLAVMSFNAGVLIAVVVGLAAGYFLFRSELGQEDLLALETSCACA